MTSFWRGDVGAAMQDLERAARYARAAGDRAQELESLRYVLGAALFGPAPVASALDRVEDVRRRTKGNRRLEVTVLTTRAHLEAMRGRIDAARELIAQAQSLAEELGLEMILAVWVLRSAGEIELLAGKPTAAERVLRTACEALERAGDWGHFASVAPILADALYALGRGDEAKASIELAARWTLRDDLDAQIGWRRVRARLLARNGDFEAAEHLAHEAMELAAQTDFLDAHAKAVADLAEVLRLAGRPEESAAALQEAIRLCEEKGNVVAAARLACASAPTPR